MDKEVPIQTEVNQLAAGAKRNSWAGSGGGVPKGRGNIILKQLLSLVLGSTTILFSEQHFTLLKEFERIEILL